MRLHRWPIVAAAACRALSRLAGAAFVLLAGATLLATAGGAAPPEGTALVVTPQDGADGSGEPLAEGIAGTPFSLKLPEGAACSGDSTDGGYRVQSFMVPDGVAPAGLTFAALGPLPKGLGAAFRQPLYAVSSTAFSNAATNLADAPGGPGTIINIPSFALDVFEPEDLLPGRYTVGIACTRGPAGPEQVDRLWSASLVLGALGADGLPSWTAPGSTGAGPADGEVEPDRIATTVASVADPPDEPAAAADRLPGATDEEPATGTAGLTGGPPTFSIPAAQLAESLSIGDSTRASLALWLVVAVVAARIAYLVARLALPVPQPA